MIDPSWWAILCLVISAAAASVARSLCDLSRTDLQQLCERSGRPQRYSHIQQRQTDTAAAFDVLRVLFAGAAVTFWAWSIHLADEPLGADRPAVASSLLWSWLGGGIALVFAELWLPAVVARRWGTPLVESAWPAIDLIGRALSPLAWFNRALRGHAQGRPGQANEDSGEAALADEIRTIVTEGEREGLLEEEARDMIEGVVDLGDVDVGQIMTPRTEMICMPLDSSWDDTLKFVGEAGHTRIPVYQRSREDIVGILHIKDLLMEMTRPAERRRPLKALLRQPLFVPETKAVNELLQDFQRSRSLMAVVLDEYGGVGGLATIADVLEQIVGEIPDEHDEHGPEEFRQISETSYDVAARVRIRDLNAQLQLQLPEDETFDTLGGFLFHELGHIPHAGEEFTWKNVHFRVSDASRRRIHRVVLDLLPGAEAEATEGTPNL